MCGRLKQLPFLPSGTIQRLAVSVPKTKKAGDLLESHYFIIHV
jgi:hypothetical protein